MFKKDSFFLGLLMGTGAPVVLFFTLYVIFLLVMSFFNLSPFMNAKSLIMLSIAPNFILVRIFFNHHKLEGTSKGIMFITFILIILFFMFIHNSHFINPPGLIRT